ncbi:sporulation protein YqfD [Paraliobacillus ryukyuensis]|uniref:sporulation protein YqfD n=1 Tax=Paraliobacillus ryukyuensis TaxID=200904 RepID=UPI0009A894B3|nr:sporulation protein YqfD [Paraliobacillus ryukyuensis]
MNNIQATWFRGYVQIQVVGYHPELFFDLCVRNNINVWHIKKMDQTHCLGNIYIHDIKNMRKLRKQTRYKISFIEKKGIPFICKRTTANKPFVLGLIASLLLIILLSNMVWKINIEGVRPEIEKQIRTTLDENGIYVGKLKFSIQSVGDMQQLLLDEIPELLWVGVKEQGTTYALEGVEKTQVSEREQPSPHDIIAAKSGVITEMYVSKGRPLVDLNDYVKKGDKLVAADLSQGKEEAEEDTSNKNQVAAQADIYADTWYESKVTIPLEADYQTLSGEMTSKYFINWGKIALPIWGFFQQEFEQSQAEIEKKSIHFFQWKLPINIIRKDTYEQRHVQEKRTLAEAKTAGISQAKKNLLQQLGREAEIKSEKILHETSENGKVKLRLYFTVKENIAKIQDLSQGD